MAATGACFCAHSPSVLPSPPYSGASTSFYLARILPEQIKYYDTSSFSRATEMIAGGEQATEWNLVMATAMLAMLPPALLVLLTQKWFVKGLVDTEK